MNNGKRGFVYLVITIVILGVIAAIWITSTSASEKSYGEFLEIAKKGEVEAVYVKDFNMDVYLKDSKTGSADFYVRIPSRQVFDVTLSEINQELVKNGFNAIDVRYNDPNSGSIWSSLIPILGFAALVGIGFYAFRMMSGQSRQAMNFGKTKARVSEIVKVKFSDVAGAEEEKEELVEIVEFLKNPQKFSRVGARIPKGVLLVGQPGTGKTLFAKAIAGEANVPFFSTSGSDFVEMYVGVGASRVRDLFDQAKKSMPCIIFIDEIDAVGRQRGAGLGGGHDEREQTLNQLLVQMDGFENNEGIIVIAATNRVDILDPALLRPGRFDRQIYVHIPDVRGREAIMRVHARNKPLADDIDYKALARITAGFTGADIENLLNEAAILCARDGRTRITMKDINEGVNKVLLGPQKKSRVITEYDKRITAFHEAGHALAAKFLPLCDPIHEVSIIPRGMAAGYTMMRPDNDNQHNSKQKLLDEIAMTMGGRAAEELFIDDICTGAQGDIKEASKVARKMVTEWGMSSLGPIYLGGGHAEVFLGRDISSDTQYSENMTAKIDAEVALIIEEAHKRAKDILSGKRELVEKLVRMLVEKETVYADEVNLLIEGKSLEEIYAYMDAKFSQKKPPYGDPLNP